MVGLTEKAAAFVFFNVALKKLPFNAVASTSTSGNIIFCYIFLLYITKNIILSALYFVI